MREKTFSMLIPVRDVPSDRFVTKRTGQKEYMVKREIVVYPENGHGEKQTIKAPDDSVYLVDERANINGLSGDKVVVWVMSRHDLMNYVDPPEDK